MKVLWLCNIILPQVAAPLGKNVCNTGGWLTGLFNDLSKHQEVQIALCFPVTGEFTAISGTVGDTEYFGFPYKWAETADLISMEDYFLEVIKRFQPDIVHIFGTEYPHTLAMFKAGEKLGILEHMSVSIQGLVSVCAGHFFAGLPFSAKYFFSLRDLLRLNNIYLGYRSFQRRGRYETEAIRLCKHIIGRTDWDRACTMQINPKAQYHHCNETLRDSFYSSHWDINSCRRHSLFMSQWNYPIKGFHIALEALSIIKKHFPDVHLFTTGSSPVSRDFKIFLKESFYAKYIAKLIRKYGLEENISFLGNLDEQHMCCQFLKTHVFISPSSIENSPNSLGEAMLLGTPVVSSDVGGVKNMMVHGKEGYIYPFDEPYMLAYYVEQIFSDDALANTFSHNAREHAAITHSRSGNSLQLLDIYKSLSAL